MARARLRLLGLLRLVFGLGLPGLVGIGLGARGLVGSGLGWPARGPLIAAHGARPARGSARARKRLARGGVTRLVDEHDGDVVPYRGGPAALGVGADQLAGLLIDAHWRVALRAGQDLQQPVIDLQCISYGVRTIRRT